MRLRTPPLIAPGSNASISSTVSTSGPYSGVRVVGNFSTISVQRGDVIRVIGVVSDPFGKTQVSFNDNVERIGAAPCRCPLCPSFQNNGKGC